MCKWYGSVEDNDLYYDESDISISFDWIEEEQDIDEVEELLPPIINEV